MARGKDTSSKMEELLEKMDAVTKSGGDYWRPDTGRNVIRILPEVGEMEWFFQEVGRHFNLPDGGSELCPSFTTGGEYDCPICDLVRELYKAGSEQARALASKLSVRKGYWINVVVRDPNDKGGDTGFGPRVYTPGKTVFTALRTLLRDPDYGEFFDPGADGYDVIVEKSGEKLNTEYNVLPRGTRCPLHKDPGTADGWLDEAIDLSWVMLDDDPTHDEEYSQDAIVILLPYDRMRDKYGVGPGIDVSVLSEEDDEKEEYKASTRSRRRSKPEDDESEEEPEKDDEPEEEDEVGSAIRQRRQRRRRPSK